MPSVLTSAWTQSFRLPDPTFTEVDLPSQAGRVFIITGGYTGVGAELCKMLYGAHATVYVAGRSQEKSDKGLAEIKSSAPESKGRLEFLKLDLADLTSIKPAVQEFESKESRLDVLINNAGVMIPPAGSVTTQSFELQVGTNCLGPHLLTSLLKPLLIKTASSSPPGSVRVAWAGSIVIDLNAPKPGGLKFESVEAGKPQVLGPQGDYSQSKTGNYFLALESGRHWGTESGVLHVSFNPGNLKTELTRHVPSVGQKIMGPFLHPAKYGAYTELYCGWSPELTMADVGVFVHPWGRKAYVRDDVAEGGKVGGIGETFWNWCEKETKAFA